MQLARNVFGEEVLEYNRWHRKATEIRTAREIEDQLDKDEILELYLNMIYVGDGVCGVQTAAQHYFGKSAADVTVAEAALLIGLANYATFGNGVHTIEPYFITRIENGKGNPIYQWESSAGTRAVDPQLGFVVLDMMRGVVRRGTGTAASGIGVPAAGKTGTTNDSRDVSFIGLTPELVAGVWLGFDRPRTIVANVGGGDLAAPCEVSSCVSPAQQDDADREEPRGADAKADAPRGPGAPAPEQQPEPPSQPKEAAPGPNP